MQGIVDIIIAGIFGNGEFNQFKEKARMWNEKLGLKR